jgi:UDP-N-acetylglucosamine acyltransferase
MEAIVHPTAIVGPKVSLADDVIVGPYAVISGITYIGKGTRISAHAVIGTAAEKHGYFDFTKGSVVIGENCVIREGVTINAGTFRCTTLGDNVVMLRGSHVGHDVWINDNVTLSCNVLVGGESEVHEGANLGLGAIVHQRSIVGSWSMLGMSTVVTKKTPIEPFKKYVGVPARCIGENTVAMERNNLTDHHKAMAMERYMLAVRKS